MNYRLIGRMLIYAALVAVGMFGVSWAAGAEWQGALRLAVGAAAGWFVGNLQDTGKFGLPDLKAFSATQPQGEPKP